MLLGCPGDARSDQWSFCASLWHSLDGAPPYDGNGTVELLETIDQDEPEFMNGALPKALRDVLRVGLSVDPNDRYPDMKTLREKLDELRQPRAIRLRWTAMTSVVLLLVGLLGGQLRCTPSDGAFVDHVSCMTAGPRAVALARAGDTERALRLLETARWRASKSQMRMLAIASQNVAGELQAHGAWPDAALAWVLSVRLAIDADDPALERLGNQGAYAVQQHLLAATPPSR